MNHLRSISIWDPAVRWFHWINVLCILGLIAIGVVILNAKVLGVSTEGKILLKTIHVWIGYVFSLNLLWRLIWAFIGPPSARWRAILPLGSGYACELMRYVKSLRQGKPRLYLGHNPLGRIAISLLFLLLLNQAITGLMLAGTDLYYPPLGSWIAQWVAAPGIDPGTLVPYAPEMVDKTAYDAMRDFRKPFITLHYYGFYAILVLGVIHIAAVVLTDIREGSNLISAMFSGKKTLADHPVDHP